MYDGSHLPFKENILKTRAVVEYAHAHGVSVEGELGTIGGTEEGIHVEEDDKVFTRPEDAVEFVAATGVDALAIAIGTITVNSAQNRSECWVIEGDPCSRRRAASHSWRNWRQRRRYPELINNGIRKFNVGTELLVNWTKIAKENFGATEINKSLRHNVIPSMKPSKKSSSTRSAFSWIRKRRLRSANRWYAKRCLFY